MIMLPCETAPGAAEKYAEKYGMKWLMTDSASPQHSDAVKSIYGIWAGPRDGEALGGGAHAGIPQILRVDRETGQPVENYRAVVNEYVEKNRL